MVIYIKQKQKNPDYSFFFIIYLLVSFLFYSVWANELGCSSESDIGMQFNMESFLYNKVLLLKLEESVLGAAAMPIMHSYYIQLGFLASVMYSDLL